MMEIKVKLLFEWQAYFMTGLLNDILISDVN